MPKEKKIIIIQKLYKISNKLCKLEKNIKSLKNMKIKPIRIKIVHNAQLQIHSQTQKDVPCPQNMTTPQ